jgi:FMN reductase
MVRRSGLSEATLKRRFKQATGYAPLQYVQCLRIEEAKRRLERSDVLLVASPQAHGTYTGLLKLFVDHVPQLGLAHAVAVPMAEVADPRNGRGIEDDLRLLLSELGSWVTEPALLLSRPELARAGGVVDAWADIVAPQIREALAVRA